MEFLAGKAIRNGDPARSLANTLNVSFPGADGEALLMGLDLEGICVSSGSACMVGSIQPSHLLLAMGVPPDTALATVRFSLSHELAHLLAKHRSGRRRIDAHGPEWRDACAALGIPDEPRCHDLPFKRRRVTRGFFYACPECSSVLARVQPLKKTAACIKCCRKHNGGKYHPRYRFRPIDRPETIAA